MAFEIIHSDEQKHVLGIIPLYIVVFPYLSSYAIDDLISPITKVLCPVLWPLFVHVMCPALVWYSCGKKNDRSKSGEGIDKGFSTFTGEMFSNLQGNDQIKLPIQI